MAREREPSVLYVGQPMEDDNQILELRKSAEKLGWQKMVEGDERDIKRAKFCAENVARNSIDLFGEAPTKLRPEWLLVQPSASPERLAAMALISKFNTSRVPFILFRPSDCVFMQKLLGFPLTRVAYDIAGHDEWLDEHCKYSRFASYARVDESTMFEVYINPELDLWRSLSVRPWVSSKPLKLSARNRPSIDCISNYIEQADNSRVIEAAELNMVQALPSPTCFDIPNLKVEYFDIAQFQGALKWKYGETSEQFELRREQAPPIRDLKIEINREVNGYAKSKRVEGLARTISAEMLTVPE